MNLHFTSLINTSNIAFAAKANNTASSKPVEQTRTLANARPGKIVTISGFGKLSPAHRQHLQAYGLLPGRSIQVLAQRPVTIVLVEQTELAFETEIARQVLVE